MSTEEPTNPDLHARRGPSAVHPGRFDPEFMRDVFARFFEPRIRSAWPSTFYGLERLPEHHDFMIVANHSGMGGAELGALIVGWRDRFGDERNVAGMAHPAGFRVPGLAQLLRGVGAVEATREGAAYARSFGVPLLLFPGGDIEATRPVWEANRIDFGRRKGWIRLAREFGLTIVPMCITGSHVTNPIIANGKALAWLTGARFFGAHRAPLPLLTLATLPLAYGLSRTLGLPRWLAALAAWSTIGPTFLMPFIPARIGFHLLEPITPDRFVDSSGDDALYDLVTGSLQRTMDDDAKERARAS